MTLPSPDVFSQGLYSSPAPLTICFRRPPHPGRGEGLSDGGKWKQTGGKSPTRKQIYRVHRCHPLRTFQGSPDFHFAIQMTQLSGARPRSYPSRMRRRAQKSARNVEDFFRSSISAHPKPLPLGREVASARGDAPPR